MKPLKCVVPGCGSTSDTHRLFCFPKKEFLLKMWLFYLVPVASSILLFSPDQLTKKRVCERHFDKHQFDYKGQRIRYSYPCLFRDSEIECGEPLATPGSGERLYCIYVVLQIFFIPILLNKIHRSYIIVQFH